MAIRDVNRSTSDATGRCADRVSAVAGWEAEALFWRFDGWTVVFGDEVLAFMSDSGCLTVAAVAAHHKVGSAKVDGCVADGVACLACGATDEAGLVPMSPDSANCTTRNGNLCAGVATAASGLVGSA